MPIPQKRLHQFGFSLALTLASIASAQAQTPSISPLQDLQTLASEKMQGRGISTPGNQLAREYIIKRLSDIGLKPCGKDFIQEFTKTFAVGKDVQGKNIVACQVGSQGEAKDAQTIVVSAHYDHLGKKNGEIYFGADDNASGVSGVLAVAEQYRQTKPKHNIVYAFFDGEETGLLGAMAFVEKNEIPKKQILINVNFDMIARGDKFELYASGTHQNPSLLPILRVLDGTGTPPIKLIFGHDRPEQGINDWTNQSDHYAFSKAGIPHIYFGVEDHADYHKPSDTADKVNPKFFNGSIEIVKKAVALIDAQFTR